MTTWIERIKEAPAHVSRAPARILQLAILLIFVCGLSSCAGDASFSPPESNQTEPHAAGEHDHAADDEFSTDMRAVLVPSELAIGPNRFAVGLLDLDSSLIDDATVNFHYYDLSDRENPFIESEADARMVTAPDGATTIYAHDREFGRAGLYGLEIEAVRADGTVLKQRIGFEVSADTATPGPGEKVPPVNTLTLSDVGGDLRLLTSSLAPDPALHEMSLAQAINSEKPTLLLLATPAYCATRFCGPSYDLFSELRADYREQFNFVYAEAFSGLPDPSVTGWQPAEVMTALALESEPWLFFLDVDGTVVFRLEGILTRDEVVRQLKRWFGA